MFPSYFYSNYKSLIVDVVLKHLECKLEKKVCIFSHKVFVEYDNSVEYYTSTPMQFTGQSHSLKTMLVSNSSLICEREGSKI